MKHKAQGALEYLLLIGGAVIVAAIVISLISTAPTVIDPIRQVTCLEQKTFAGCNNTTGCTPQTIQGGTALVSSEFFICMTGIGGCAGWCGTVDGAWDNIIMDESYIGSTTVNFQTYCDGDCVNKTITFDEASGSYTIASTTMFPPVFCNGILSGCIRITGATGVADIFVGGTPMPSFNSKFTITDP